MLAQQQQQQQRQGRRRETPRGPAASQRTRRRRPRRRRRSSSRSTRQRRWLTALLAVTVTVGCWLCCGHIWLVDCFIGCFRYRWMLHYTVWACSVAIFGWLTALLAVIITAGCCYMYIVQCTCASGHIWPVDCFISRCLQVWPLLWALFLTLYRLFGRYCYFWLLLKWWTLFYFTVFWYLLSWVIFKCYTMNDAYLGRWQFSCIVNG